MWLSIVWLSIVALCPGCGGSTGTAGKSGLGELSAIKGVVTLTHEGKPVEIRPGQTQQVAAGDTVRTGPDSEAVVRSGRRVQFLDHDSELRVEAPPTTAPEGGRVHLLKGLATFLLPPSPDKKVQFEAVSNSVVAAVKGTIFCMQATDGGAEVTVVEGEVEVRLEGSSAATPPAVARPQERVVARAGNLATLKLSEQEFGALRTEALAKKARLGVGISTY
ncbi:MAG: FecR domain-containing protein [Candidatus Riflebacteria bacterium]|nr:FecR domain-containing protein [Candidatus Riflebacteria bacterium]